MNSRSTYRALIAAAVSAVLLVASLAFVPSAVALTARTQITRVQPVDQYDVLKSGWIIDHQFYGGQCSEGSEAVVGADRCFLGNNIYDPCWPTVNRYNRYNGSYCPSTAWSRSGILIKGHHQAGNDDQGKTPWGLGLASGLRCMETEGAGSTYKGTPVDYFCEHSRIWLVGRPWTATRSWHILAIKYSKQWRVVAHWTAAIGHVWMGVSPYGV